MQPDSQHQVGFISDETVTIFHTVNLAILGGGVATFGILTNVVNVVIFMKQGFGDTVNISLMALAISDLCALITLQWVTLLRNPLFIYKVSLLPDEVQHLSAAWPHACFARITSWITVYITMERCICVIVPMKVKNIVRPKFALCFLLSIFSIMFLTLVPDYSTCYLGWKHDVSTNRSMVGLLFLDGREQMAALSFFLAAFTQITSFGAVIIFTFILVIKMKQHTQWRTSIANAGNSSTRTQKRDNKTIQMVILIAIIYCVCFLPMMLNYIATCIEPEFIIVGLYRNAFLVAWSFAFLIDSVNSSVNIFVYYKMSTKYRTTFDQIICRICCSDI